VPFHIESFKRNEKADFVHLADRTTVALMLQCCVSLSGVVCRLWCMYCG